jgi:hypothetical protein
LRTGVPSGVEAPPGGTLAEPDRKLLEYDGPPRFTSVLTVIDAEEGSEAVISTGYELANGLEKAQVIVHVVPSIDGREEEANAVVEVVRDALGERELPTVRVAEAESIWEDIPSGGIAEGSSMKRREPMPITSSSAHESALRSERRCLEMSHSRSSSIARFR